MQVAQQEQQRVRIAIAHALEEKNRRKKENRLERYRPYPKQAYFHDLGTRKRERLLMAGNQLGKTLCAGAEIAMHLTGRYPDWWTGKRFSRPAVIWVAGVTAEGTRDGAQRMLFGRPGQWGTGMIPKSCIQEIKTKRGVADAIDYLDPLLDAAQDGSLPVDQVSTRAEMWVNKTLTGFYNAGRISADKNGYYMWKLGKTEQHCPDCARLNGQVHRFKEWYVRGWIPQSDKLACHGYRCDCRLDKAQGPGNGRF